MSAWAALLAVALTAAPRSPLPPAASALPTLAEALAKDITPGTEGPVAVAMTSESPELARELQTLLCGALAARGLAPLPLEGTGPAVEAAARAAGAHALVRLRLLLGRDELLARGDLLGTWVNFWSGTSPTRPATPARLLHLAVPAETGTGYFSEPSGCPDCGRLRLSPRPLAQWPGRPWALASGEVGPGGQKGLVVLTQEALEVRSLSGQLLATHRLEGQPSDAPARDGFGVLALTGGTEPRVGYLSSAWATGAWLKLDAERGLVVERSTEELPLCGEVTLSELVPGQNVFQRRHPESGASHALATCDAARPNGARSLASRVEVTAEGDATWDGASLKGLGASAALVQLGAGAPWALVASSPGFAPELDMLLLWRTPQSSPQRVLGVPGRILQVARVPSRPSSRAVLVLGIERPDGTGELREVTWEGP